MDRMVKIIVDDNNDYMCMYKLGYSEIFRNEKYIFFQKRDKSVLKKIKRKQRYYTKRRLNSFKTKQEYIILKMFNKQYLYPVWQYQIGRYAADFVFEEEKLIVELDGGVHNIPKVIERDRLKDIYYKKKWTVIRIKYKDFKKEKWDIIDKVIDICEWIKLKDNYIYSDYKYHEKDSNEEKTKIYTDDNICIKRYVKNDLIKLFKINKSNNTEFTCENIRDMYAQIYKIFHTKKYIYSNLRILVKKHIIYKYKKCDNSGKYIIFYQLKSKEE